MSVNTKGTFSRDKLDHTKDNEGHLMVTIEAPERDFERTPLCVSLVLDISGSMSFGIPGESAVNKTKCESMKDAARCIVQQLSSKDEVSIVGYTSTSTVLLARTKVTDKERIYAAINQLSPQATTNMGAGLIDGFKQMNPDFTGSRRIFLLSDGLNNDGMTNPQVQELVAKRLNRAVVSTFGLGTDCDQEFMADLSKAGGGSYYFISNASDMKETFARELGGALACEAQNIEVTVRPNNGNEILKVLNDFTVENKSGGALIKAEDLFVGERKHILVQMKIPEVPHPKPRAVSVAHVEISYHDVGKQTSVKTDCNVTVTFVKPAEADTEDKLAVREQVAILDVAEKSLEAVKLADAGDFLGASLMYAQAVQNVDECALAGSVMCASLQPEMAGRSEGWSAGSYTPNFGASNRSDARGILRNKGTTGIARDVYGTQSAESMVKVFNESHSQPVGTESIASVPQAPDEDPPKKPEKPKGFGKERSGMTR